MSKHKAYRPSDEKLEDLTARYNARLDKLPPKQHPMISKEIKFPDGYSKWELVRSEQAVRSLWDSHKHN